MATDLLQSVLHIADTFTGMVWQIYWPLAFGLMLSSVLRHILPVDTVVHHLGRTTPKSLLLTTLLGMVSSSCSYAAASLSRTLLIKKASLANAMAFLVASTNLILEMFIVLVSLLGWQFLWGEITGGIILIILVALLFKAYPAAQERALRAKLADNTPPQAVHCDMPMHHTQEATTMDCGMDMSAMSSTSPSMPEHCDMAMPMRHDSNHTAQSTASPSPATTPTPSPLMAKVRRSAGFFQMDIAMIGKEILIGVVISSLLIAMMPDNWWRELFIGNNSQLPATLHSALDVVIGIAVAVLAYVCSVGNLLLAAALWHGGISFGGVMGFILADVLTIPMTRVYRNYYGKTPARWMVALLFIAILLTGLLIDWLCWAFGWQLSRESLHTLHQAGFGWNITTLMNLIFIPLSLWYYRLGRQVNGNTMTM